MSTDIELVTRALTDFNAVEAGLQALREQYSGVVFEVTTTKGMDEARQARLALRAPRYEIERIRKGAKAPLLSLGKKLDDDAKRITAEIEKLEAPINLQIKNEEERKEREKEAKIAAEAARTRAINDRIDNIRGAVGVRFGDDLEMVKQHIADIEAEEINASFAEFEEQAHLAKASTLARLREIQAGIVERLEREAQIAAERAELERLRAEQAERVRIEDERRAEEERQAKAARDAEEAAAKAIRDAEAAAQAEALRAEREALVAEQQERQRVLDEQQRLIDEESARQAAERAELERQQEALRKAQEPAPKAPRGGRGVRPKRPTDEEIIAAVATAFKVAPQTAAGWIAEMKGPA